MTENRRLAAMRRLAAQLCLAALLAGEVAHAKSLIVYTSYPGTDTEALAQKKRNIRLVESIISATGGEFRTVSSIQSRTEWFRLGQHVWNPQGSAGAFVEQFDASISIGSNRGNNTAGRFRPDSLSKTIIQGGSGAVGSAVPALVMRDNSGGVSAADGDGGTEWTSPTASLDSVGIETITQLGVVGAFYQNGFTEPFLSHAPSSPGVTLEASGANLRPILSFRTPAFQYRRSRADDGGTLACKDCDSLQAYTASDSLAVWDKEWGTSPDGTWGVGLGQATTITYAAFGGPGALNDSIYNIDLGTRPPTEGEFMVLLAALAHLDSLVRASSTTGGKVLGDKAIVVAPIVYGGLARGQRHTWQSPGSAQGIFDPDTSAFYAILDSLNNLGIPITFAVNVDSAQSYQRDIIKMKSVKGAKFTPQVWTGVADTTVASNASMQRPIDVFGRFRRRAALGDSLNHTVNSADTSIYWLARRSLMMTDSIFGRNNVSRVAVAPDDDWSPRNVGGVGRLGRDLPAAWTLTPIDSVLLALRLAGFQGVVANGQDPDCNASKRNGGPSQSNPRGFYQEQSLYSSAMCSGLRDFKILTHSGYSIMGGRAQTITFADSTEAAPLEIGHFYKELSRLYTGALMDVDNSYDTWAYDGLFSNRDYDNIHQRKVDRTQAAVGKPAVRGNVFRLCAGDLSGVPYGGPGGSPAATGYWVLKSAKNAFDTINRLAGRTVIRFGYPEEIDL